MVIFCTITSHWWRHPAQFLVLILGLAMATALWSGVQAINEEARASYDRSAAALTDDVFGRIEPTLGTEIPLIDYVLLRRSGWLVSPVIEGMAVIGGTNFRVIGIDPLTAPEELASPMALAADGPQAVLGSEALGFVAPGTDMDALASEMRLIENENVAPGVLLTDISVAARILGQTNPNYFIAASQQSLQQDALTQLTPGLRIADTPTADIARLTDSFHLNLTAFGFLSFAVGLFIVHSTIGLAFEQRRGMFRTLRALGTPLHHLVAALMVEVTALAIFSGVLGLFIGYLVAAALLPDVAGTLRSLYGAEIDGTLVFRPVWALAGLGIAVFGAWVAGAEAIYRVIKMPILAPAQPRAWAVASSRTVLRQAAIGMALVLAGLAFALVGQSLSSGFASMAGILIGAALLLPGCLLLAISGLSAKARRPMTEWIIADMRVQLPGLSIALMALLLALAANIGVSTMVGSFRSTFNGWLDQRLVAELYVRAGSSEEADEIRAFLASEVDAVLPVAFTELAYQQAPLWLYGVVDHASYRDHWPMLETIANVWDRLHRDEAVLINEQMALRYALRVGDTVTLPMGRQMQIGGIYSDYGNPTAQAIVSMDVLNADYSDISRQRTGLRLDPDDIPNVIARLNGEFSLPPGAIINQESLKAQSRAIFDQTFRVTDALNVLTLSVAAFALFSSMLTLSNIRIPQLAPVWAIGVTRRRLAGIELLRILALVFLTWCVAIPVGLGLAWVLLTVVNVQAFGWRLPMQVFPVDWARLLAFAAFASLMAALYPALGLLRLQPAQLLKVFSNER